MKKQLIATCILLLLFSLLPIQGLAEKEGPKKRAVALVYDDSGSMRNGKDRWKYASYALQSFIGLLDERDSFSFIPMSRPSQEITMDLSKAKRQEEIDSIRQWNQYKNTPFTAVETAIASIKRQVAADANGEFWLIVLTDGAFNELESPQSAQYDANKKRITDTMRSFAAWMEGKNASVHSVLITMDQDLSAEEKAQMDAFQQIWQDTMNGMVLTAGEEDGIIKSVDQAAALIANRDPFSGAEDYVQVKRDGEKLKVSTPFPLRRLTIVQQTNGQEQLPRLEEANTPSLRIDGPFQTETPENNMITGSIIHVVPKTGDVMKPGDYELQFQGNVSSSVRWKVLAEPALDYTMHVYKKEENRLVEAKDGLYAGSTVVIEAKPNDLPVDALYFSSSIEYNGNSASMRWNEKRKAFQYEIKLSAAPVRGSIHMNIKGFYRQSKEFRITPVPKPKLSIAVLTNDWNERVNHLTESKPIIIQPLLNGKEMKDTEVARLLESASVTFNKHINYEWKQYGNQLYLYPRPYISDTLNFTDTGLVEATISLRDPAFEEVKQKVTIRIEDVSFFERYAVIFRFIIPVGAAALVVLIILVGWVVRPRFQRKGLIYYELDQSISEDWIHEAEPQLLRNPWWRHYLGIPYRSERRTVQSIIFIAKKGTKAVWIAKESQVEGMMIDGSFLEEEEIGKEHKTLYPNETVVIDKGYGKEVYRYECD
jgi:hypothetical protein